MTPHKIKDCTRHGQEQYSENDSTQVFILTYNIQKCSDLNKEHTLLIRSGLKVISNTLWGLEQSLSLHLLQGRF